MHRIGKSARTAATTAAFIAVGIFFGPAAAVAAATTTLQTPASETTEGLIAKGRALLAEGKPAEARQAFEAAEKLDGSTLKTRMWTLRSWVAEGRVNDALNEIDKLDRAGQKCADMDYLYGIAFASKAKGYIQERASGGVISMAFNDAVSYLQRATTADPVKYADAFLPLAESAWYAHDLDIARTAADRAVANAPQDPDAYSMLGQVALAQFRTVNEDESKKAEADKAWEAARAANAKVV
jgi:tetratricopeptide (TPR) repeat protein